MALFLFGFEVFVATLLWGAFLVAWYARKRVWWRQVPAVLGSLALLIPWVVLTIFFVSLYHPRLLFAGYVWLIAKLSLGTVIGLAIIWYRGLSRDGITGELKGAHWSMLRLFGGAFVVTLLAQTTLWTFDAFYQQRLSEVQREAQSLAQTLAPVPVLDQENAAALYFQAFEAMGVERKHPSRTELEDRPKGDAAPEEPDVSPFQSFYWRDIQMSFAGNDSEIGPFDFKSQRLGKFLEQQKKVREILIRASKKPACRFERDFVRPTWAMLLPEMGYLRSAARFLLVDARHAAATGDFTRAREDIEACYRMAIQIKQEPIVISQLVGIAIEKIADVVVQIILAESVTVPQEFLDLSIPAQMPALATMDRSVRYEEAMMTNSIAEMGLHPFRSDTLIPLLAAPPDQIWVLQLLTMPFARAFFADAVLDDFRTAFNGSSQSLQPLSRITKEEWEDISRGDDLVRTDVVRSILPNITLCKQAAIKGEIHRRQVQIALGLYRYYHANGEDGKPRQKFPATLNELVPAYLDFVPSDPFNENRSMSYRVTEKGFIVYSVGPNEIDDLGIAAKEGESTDAGDFAVECLIPKEPSFPAKSESP